jgi:NAD(P)-dependent dehydrogenase (short-subunit alcohol dehydrogenase family)
MGQLKGKVAVVTGSSRGLGLAIAQAYLQEGASVIVSSRSQMAVADALQRLPQDPNRVSGIVCDVGDFSQVQALAGHALDTFGRIDIWVNNAAISGTYGPTAHIQAADFVEVLQTNILGVYYGSWIALQHFLPQRSGKLINIQGAGDRRPGPFQNAYSSSKAWVRSFTAALAKEYAAAGVGIYALNPGLMHTDLIQRFKVVAGFEKRLAPFKTVIRMWGKPPEEPAQQAVWLASRATDGRIGLEVRTSNIANLLQGALRELWRRLLRRPSEPIEFDLQIVPPVLKTTSQAGSKD